MKKNTILKITTASLVSLSLAACGGSNTDDEDIIIDYDKLAIATDQIDVTGVSLNSSTAATSTSSLTFDGASDTVGVNSVSVALATDDLRSKASDGSALDYVSALQNSGGATKLIAIKTDPRDLPSGTAEFTGHANVTLTTGAGQYSGVMPTTVTANFGTAMVKVKMNGLTLDNPLFTLVNGVPTEYTSTGAEYVELDQLDMNGSSFAAGNNTTATVSGFGTAGSTTRFNSPEINASGVFAGPQAAEVAGAATISGSGGRELLTTFSGKK